MKWLMFSILCFPLLVFGAGNAKKRIRFRPTVILDAGHGGWNAGAKIPRCEEKRLALTTVQLTKRYLERLGYRVRLTRSHDFYLPLPNRVHVANRSKAGLFVSIHFNSCTNAIAHGIEVYYHKNLTNKKRSVASRRLAQCVLLNSAKRTNSLSRGVKTGNFYVIRKTLMPAILIEGGFLSHPEESKRLRQRNHLEKLAKGIAEGIHSYIKNV